MIYRKLKIERHELHKKTWNMSFKIVQQLQMILTFQFKLFQSHPIVPWVIWYFIRYFNQFSPRLFFLSANTVTNDPVIHQVLPTNNSLVKGRMYKNSDLSNFCKGATNLILHFLWLRSISKNLMGVDENMTERKLSYISS